MAIASAGMIDRTPLSAQRRPMPNLADTLLPRLTATRLPGLDLGQQAVHPAYDGLSILNLPPSFCRWFRSAELPHPPLAVPGLDDLASGARQIVVVLIDAVSFDRFARWIAELPMVTPAFGQDYLLMPLTSVVPSTTVSALTTLWTGRSPAEHGQVGYELLLKEFGLVANMLNHSPVALDRQAGLLLQAGFEPTSALPVPTLGPHLHRAGVEAHAFLPHSIRGSGLSRMHLNDVALHSYATLADLWVALRDLADRPLDHPRLLWAYYGEVDALSHRYGPDSEQPRAEFEALMQGLVSGFINRLSAQARSRSLLILLSDHGQIATRKDPHFEVRNHPGLVRWLHLLPTGENRLAYLYHLPGRYEEVAGYFEQTWPGAFRLLASAHALQAGLFGPGAPAEATSDRIGDVIAVSQGDAYLWWAAKENVLLGRHGGLSREEMLVPLLATRLG